MLEHPEITITLATGYPLPPRMPAFYCDRCGGEINNGDDYYDFGEEFLCRECVDWCHRTAGED